MIEATNATLKEELEGNRKRMKTMEKQIATLEIYTNVARDVARYTQRIVKLSDETIALRVVESKAKTKQPRSRQVLDRNNKSFPYRSASSLVQKSLKPNTFEMPQSKCCHEQR